MPVSDLVDVLSEAEVENLLRSFLEYAAEYSDACLVDRYNTPAEDASNEAVDEIIEEFLYSMYHDEL